MESPLCIGITFASFNALGKQPSLMHLLKIRVSESATIWLEILTISGDML